MDGKWIFASICVIGASVVAYSGNDGWGWLLVIAALAL